MNSDIEDLAREGMRQFTETMQVSPDLAARTFTRHRQRRHLLRAGLALGAAGAVTAVAALTVVAHSPATKATPIAAPVLRARLLAAIDSASGDILYTATPGGPLDGGQYPAFPQPGQEVHVRVGPDLGSDGNGQCGEQQSRQFSRWQRLDLAYEHQRRPGVTGGE